MKFTDEAQQAILFAQEHAKRLRHSTVEPEHLLLGLLGQKSPEVFRILTHYSVIDDELGSQLEKLLGKDHSKLRLGEIPFDVSFKKVLELAVAEAQEMSFPSIRTGHLFLGILLVVGRASKILSGKGIELTSLRNFVRSDPEEARQFDVHVPLPTPALWPKGKTASLAQLLVHAGLMTVEKIAELEKFSSTDMQLAEEIERRGLATPSQMAKMVGLACQVPYFLSLEGLYHIEESRKLMPESFAIQHMVVPLFLIDNTLTVATLNPLNKEVSDALVTSKFVPQFVVSTIDEIPRALYAIYHGPKRPAGSSKVAAVTVVPSVVQVHFPARSTIEEIVKQIEAIVKQAHSKNANQIWLKFSKSGLEVWYVIGRKAGPVMTIPPEFSESIRATLKALVQVNAIENRRASNEFVVIAPEGEIKVRLQIQTRQIRMGISSR